MKHSDDAKIPPEFSQVLANNTRAQNWLFSLPKEKRAAVIDGAMGLKSSEEFIVYLNNQILPGRE